MKISASFYLVGLLFCASVSQAADEPAAARVFGEAVPADASISSLQDAVAVAEQAGDQVISGRVGQVCQKKGCWMTLSDGEHMARVMTDHKFVIPKDLSGEVLVYGDLQAFDLDADEVAHMAKDSGKDIAEIDAHEYRIAARGVQLR